MVDLTKLTIKKFHDGLRAKEFSAREVAQAHFERIKKCEPEIGAYLSLAEESALRDAEAVDGALAKNESLGYLAGVPLAIKDAILVKGLPATSASKMLEHYVASYDAGVIEKLKAQKAIFLGKTNMDEFAMGSSTENSAFKLTHNPHDLDRVPGGSSGGSAAAVAADMAIGALGSDTFSSVRLPASFCGVVGLKPTYGAVSRSGLIAMTSSLDQIGPLTKTVEDNAILFKAIAGKDRLDATSAEADYGHVADAAPGDIKHFTIGLPDEYFIGGLDNDVAKEMEAAIEKLKKLGIKFKKISLPHTKYAVPAYYLSMPAEVSSNLARFDGIRYGVGPDEEREKNLMDIYLKTRGKKFGAEAKRRIILGTFVLSSGYYDAYYDKAQRVRTLVKQDFDEAFKDVDVMLTPVSPTPAFKIGEKVSDPLAMYLSDVFTGPANLAGVCAISIPTKPSSALAPKELPIGFQLIGKKWHEADIFNIGRHYEDN
jgi:aspartyl-tRNA(Asn)/glutamyl-tRNA(Gln) amidotransferase subunit A